MNERVDPEQKNRPDESNVRQVCEGLMLWLGTCSLDLGRTYPVQQHAEEESRFADERKHEAEERTRSRDRQWQHAP